MVELGLAKKEDPNTVIKNYKGMSLPDLEHSLPVCIQVLSLLGTWDTEKQPSPKKTRATHWWELFQDYVSTF